MNLDDIQNGSLCVVDTNVLLYAEQGVSYQSQRLLRRCATGDVIVTLPQTVWHELAHKLMMAEAMMAGKISGSNPAAKLAKKPDIVKQLGLYKEKVLALNRIGLGFEPCTKTDFFESAFSFQKKYGLLTNDSLILTTAVRLKADVLATADATFQDVVELQVAMPSDIQQ
jgi:predicted nucleic acid-binding protein